MTIAFITYVCMYVCMYRRKADPVKGLIQQLLARGRERDGRATLGSYKEITSIMRDLGSFYSKSGPRARLASDLRSDILARLDKAEYMIGQHE